MINRHEIRVKVLQLLTQNYFNPTSLTNLENLFLQELKSASSLFHYILYFIHQVGNFSIVYAEKKSTKLLPSITDLTINHKLAANSIILTFKKESLEYFNQNKPNILHWIDQKLIEHCFLLLKDSEEYRNYIKDNNYNEKKIIEFIVEEILLENELFWQHIESHFLFFQSNLNWIKIRIKNYSKNFEKFSKVEIISSDKIEFGKLLLSYSLNYQKDLDQSIQQKLEKWDFKRLAIIDIILCRLCLIEFLYFNNIPVSVSLNEYIEIAKEYSTDNSGQFINGILNSILMDWKKDNRLLKDS